MERQKVLRSCGTHDGTFHADEVTACAFLILFDLIDRDKVVRTRDPKKLSQCEFVCDVGGEYDAERKLFDHHHAEYQGPLSSAGMVLLYLKEQGILTQKEYQFFNETLIIGVDAHDNGEDPQILGLCTYSNVISNFTSIQYNVSDEERNEAFGQALDFAYAHLKRLWERYHYINSCREVVAEVMNKDKECLMFDKAIPWLEMFFELEGGNHPAQFVIMPSGEHWKLRGIPPSYEERMKVRHPLPEEWAGLSDQDLQKASGVAGAIFCHKGRFISVWKTQDDALQALDYILQKEK